MTTAEPRTYSPSGLVRLEPDPLFARLREQEPMCRIRLPYGEPAWLATRYEDVKTVLADPRFSRAAAVGRDEPRLRPQPTPPDTIMSVDPPEHSRLRRLVAKAFTTRRVELLRPRAVEIADRLVDEMVAGGAPADLVADFALPLPVTVICELLGVPYDDRRDFRVWSDAFLSTTKYSVEDVRRYAGLMREYMAGLIALRRESARDDLLSALVAARDDEDRLSEDELLAMAEGILIAGHETTASQIPNFLYVLLTHPTPLAALRADLDLVPRAVEELMRFVPLSVGTGIPRYATEDVELGGVTVRAGEPVVASIASANHDPSVFTEADDLDLHREGTSHIGFGHGPHHCLGAQLARMELQVALTTLLSRLPGLRLADENTGIDWKTGVSTRGPARMLLTWD